MKYAGVKRCCTSLLTALMALVLTCGPYSCARGLAWLSMILEYVPEQGLLPGLEQTFDGMHPCPLCLQIEANEENDAQALLQERLNFIALDSPGPAGTASPAPVASFFTAYHCALSAGEPAPLLRPPIV